MHVANIFSGQEVKSLTETSKFNKRTKCIGRQGIEKSLRRQRQITFFKHEFASSLIVWYFYRALKLDIKVLAVPVWIATTVTGMEGCKIICVFLA